MDEDKIEESVRALGTALDMWMPLRPLRRTGGAGDALWYSALLWSLALGVADNEIEFVSVSVDGDDGNDVSIIVFTERTVVVASFGMAPLEDEPEMTVIDDDFGITIIARASLTELGFASAKRPDLTGSTTWPGGDVHLVAVYGPRELRVAAPPLTDRDGYAAYKSVLWSLPDDLNRAPQYPSV